MPSALVAAAVLLSGCLGFSEPEPDAADPKQTAASEQRGGDSAQGTPQLSSGTQVPPDFPPHIALPAIDPTTVARSVDNNAITWALGYETITASAFDQLGQDLIASGFAEVSNVTVADSMSVGIYADEHHTVSITMLGEQGEEMLQLVVMETDE